METLRIGSIIGIPAGGRLYRGVITRIKDGVARIDVSKDATPVYVRRPLSSLSFWR